MLAIYCVNKCDKSTMTDLEIVRITAIYKDKNEIVACFGFYEKRITPLKMYYRDAV